MAHEKEPPTTFARAVRDARKSAGLTQVKLAMVLGVAPSTVYRIEQGGAPDDGTLKALRRWSRDLPAPDAAPAGVEG